MFDISFTELLIIGVVALLVIGPERLPKVARTAGHLFGRLQRYVNDVKADINREVELDELRKVQSTFQEAARSFEDSVRSVEKSVNEAGDEIRKAGEALDAPDPGPARSEPAPSEGSAASDGGAPPREPALPAEPRT